MSRLKRLLEFDNIFFMVFPCNVSYDIFCNVSYDVLLSSGEK